MAKVKPLTLSKDATMSGGIRHELKGPIPRVQDIRIMKKKEERKSYHKSIHRFRKKTRKTGYLFTTNVL
jgi:hypothetical protein